MWGKEFPSSHWAVCEDCRVGFDVRSEYPLSCRWSECEFAEWFNENYAHLNQGDPAETLKETTGDLSDLREDDH